MLLEIKIECKSKKRLMRELKEMFDAIELEINDPICKDCSSCKDMKKGCEVGGGTTDYSPKLESSWLLKRTYSQHKKICKSTQKH